MFQEEGSDHQLMGSDTKSVLWTSATANWKVPQTSADQPLITEKENKMFKKTTELDNFIPENYN